MLPQSGSPLPLVVGDTDVLLCAGHVQKQFGIGLLYKRLNPRLHIPTGVMQELQGMSRSTDSYKRHAALKMIGPRARFIQRIEDNSSSSTRQTIRQEVEAAEEELAKSARRPYKPKPGGHHGEIEGILVAEAANGVLLSNDRAARLVATRRGIAVATYATLLAAEVRDGALLVDEAIVVCYGIDQIGWNCGLRNIDALQLTQMPIPFGV